MGKNNPEKIMEKCKFCQAETETVKNLLYQCKEVEKLWKNLERTIDYFLNLKVRLDVVVVILNNYKAPSADIINQLIVIMKQYIHSERCWQVMPQFHKFMARLSTWYLIDKHLVYENFSQKKLKQLQKKWKNFF